MMSNQTLTGIQLQLRQLQQKYLEQQALLSAAETRKWFVMVQQLQHTVSEMSLLLHHDQKQMNVSFLLNEEVNGGIGQAQNAERAARKLDRKAFYSSDSPYQHRTDRSGTFRLCPPFAHTSAAEYFPGNSQEPLIISDSQILENLANLKRLAEFQKR